MMMGAALEVAAHLNNDAPVSKDALKPAAAKNSRLAGTTLHGTAARDTAIELIGDRADESAGWNNEFEQLAWLAAHDLQEPLRMIVGFLQLLSQRYQSRLDKEAQEFIGFAVDGAWRMKQLLDDLLEYSRAGRQRELGAVALEPVLDRALTTLALRIRESGATVVRRELPRVIGDEPGLYCVFVNLIGNALKFRGPASPEIRIGAEMSGNRAVIFVEDNGIGIEPEHQERIFRLFQRLHGREEYEGNGVGLALCRRIVTRFGGQLGVESESGKGSIFRFSLALAPPPPSAR
jgi:light-regulated signal transduction histidine kinase (bacteriophytochrome)